MNKWFAYIVLLLISLPFLLAARSEGGGLHVSARSGNVNDSLSIGAADTTNKAKPPTDDKKNKIKEISKAKQVPKPEKVDDANNAQKAKKRQHRPPGMERPPEIPRHNGN